MRHSVPIHLLLAAATALLLALAACQDGSKATLAKERDQYRAELDKERAAAEAQRQYIAEMTRVLNEVQDSLAEIRRDELNIVWISAVADKEGWTRKSQKKEVLQDIESIRTALHENQAKLSALEGRFDSSTVRIASLTSLVAGLQNTLGEQERSITSLRKNIDALHTEIQQKDKLISEQGEEIVLQEEQIVEQQDRIERFQEEDRKAYLLVRPAEELKRLGVAEVKRGTLGVRRHWRLTNKFEKSLFEEINIEDSRDLSIASPLQKVEILSSHPASSYSLEAAGPRSTVLRIHDPQKFWQFRFLIILTKP
jgi:chromosome segregation ATPase